MLKLNEPICKVTNVFFSVHVKGCIKHYTHTHTTCAKSTTKVFFQDKNELLIFAIEPTVGSHQNDQIKPSEQLLSGPCDDYCFRGQEWSFHHLYALFYSSSV